MNLRSCSLPNVVSAVRATTIASIYIMASRLRLAQYEPFITPFYLITITNDTYLKIELQYTQHFTNIALLDSHVYVGRE